MAKISTYPILSTPTINDLLIGTDVDNLNNTKNFSIGDIASFIVGGNYVPYTGATANVNLGTFNITSGGFIVGEGTASQFLKANGTLDSTVYQPAGNYITQLSGEATASGPGNATVTLSNSAVTGKLLTGLNITGSVITAADTILTAFGKVQNQINTLVGGVQYKGTWNAATNTPTLVSSVGVQGNYYVVSVAGNTNLNGITDWQLGDWAIFNGSAWEKVDNTDAVISVNGQVGAVVLTTTNIAEGTNLYYTDLRARGAINLTTVGNSGAATYNNTNGFFNIPEYTLSGLGGVPSTRQLTINGTAFDLSANRSWNVGTVTSVATTAPITGGTITGSGTIGITQASSTTDGYLSSTDWTTFNSKQNAITNPVTGTGTAFFLPMWSNASNLVNSPLSYLSDTFTFQYNSATGGTVNFTNSNGTAYAYTIQMNNFGSPRSTVHSYTDGIVVQSIGGVQVSRVFANGNTVFGTGVSDNGHKLELSGSLFVNTIANATIDTDRFLVSDSGVIKYRTGTELRSDIGAGVGSVTSVGLTMPSAFSVANSPITGAGTLAVTGAGNASQYVRGDGTLADFPTSTGGGSSVSYYLNGSVSQGTIGGVAYRELSEVPVFGAGTDISIAADGYIASFITDAGDPALLNIPAGNWNFETYFSASSGGGTPSFYVELYRYDGTTFTLIASSSSAPELISFGTNIQPYFSTLAVPQTALAVTDRLAIRYYVNVSGRTITIHTEDNHLCQVVTTFSNGLTALNGLTDQVQFFQVGTSGTDFNISSISPTHTFNLPDASASNRGAVTTGTQTFAGYKIFNGTIGVNNDIQLATQGTALNTFIKNINATGLTSIGSNGFGFNNANNIYFSGSNKGGGVFAFSNTGTQIYTLPDASGTISLTSDLGAYLPLSGGTMTGAINGISANFTSNLSSDSGVYSNTAFFAKHNPGSTVTVNGWNAMQGDANTFIVLNSTKGMRINFPSNASFTHTLPDASGTIALTSNLSSYLPLSGGTLTGALNGTTASFDSTGTYVLSLNNTAQDTRMQLQVNGTQTFQLSSSSSQVNIFGATNIPMIFYTNATERFRIANSGAATFSSSVTAGGTANAANGGFIVNYSTISGSSRSWRMANDLQVFGDFGIEQSTTQTGSTYATRFYIGASGNVGIGTTSPAAKLDVASGNPASAEVQRWSYNDGNPAYSLRLRQDVTSGLVKHVFDLVNNSTTYSNNLVLTNGNVGIGTDSPIDKLNVSGGGITLTGTLSSPTNTTIGSLQIGYDGTNGIIRTWSSSPLIFSNYNYQSFETNGTERMRITGSGNVGIGTASPQSWTRLEVAGTAGAQTDAAQQVTIAAPTTTVGHGAGLRFNAASGAKEAVGIVGMVNEASGNLGAMTFHTYGGGANIPERMRITSGGNVGIGTNSPTTYSLAGRHLEVNDAGGGYAFIHNNTTSVKAFLASSEPGGHAALYTFSNHPLLFGTGNTERMRISSTGNVGIGTTSPLSTLVVSNGSNENIEFTSGSSILNGGVIEYINRTSGTTRPDLNIYNGSSNGSVKIYTGGNTERMRITSGGNVLIGTENNSPSAGHGLKNYADGRIYCVSSATSNASESYGMYSTGASNYRFYVGWGGTIFATNTTISGISDARLKENVRDLDAGLDKIMALKPRVFDWKEGKGKDIKNDRGFIAQEFEEVFPDLIDEYKQEVEEGEEPYKSVRADLIPVLVKAMQEQQEQIKSLTEQVEALKSQS